MKEKTTYCLSELKALGWTPKIINELLPEPTLKKNPMYACASPMKIWNISDVDKAMQTPEFMSHYEKHIKKQEISKKAVNTKKQKAIQELEEIKNNITIIQMDKEKLKKATLYAKQYWYLEHDNYDDDPYTADTETLHRWMVNYIRHNLTSYDENLYHLYGKVGKDELYFNLKKFILEKISIQYPYLAHECYLQIEKERDNQLFCKIHKSY